MEAGGRQKREALGAGIARGKAGPREVQGQWWEGEFPGRLIFWSGDSQGWKTWLPRTIQNIKTVEIMNLAVTLLPSLVMVFLMSFMEKKKKSPNNVFLLLFSSSALLQHVGIPHTFLQLTQAPGSQSPEGRAGASAALSADQHHRGLSRCVVHAQQRRRPALRCRAAGQCRPHSRPSLPLERSVGKNPSEITCSCSSPFSHSEL